MDKRVSPGSEPIVVRRLGRRPYQEVYEAMRGWTHARTQETVDELWLVEHDPVYTMGRSPLTRDERTKIGGIPVVAVDRGGDMTYHGPGQIVAYPLIDLRRRGLFVREFVRILEASVIETLAAFSVPAFVHAGAPGVYAALAGGSGPFQGEAKIASLGVHVSRGASYHGLALNVDMDLRPFSAIAPCGYQALRVTDMRALGSGAAPSSVLEKLQEALLARL